MRLVWASIAITLAFFSHPALAGAPHFANQSSSKPEDDCGSVRLDSPGGSMEHVPVVDQGDFGVCYAATGAEMTDAFRYAHGGSTSRHSSMFAAALGNASGRGESMRGALVEDGGFFCDVANFSRVEGSCDASVLSGKGNQLETDLTFLSQSYDIQDEEKPDPCGIKPGNKESDADIHHLIAGQACTQNEADGERLATTRQALMQVLGSVTERVETELWDGIKKACSDAGLIQNPRSKCEESRMLTSKDSPKTESKILNYLSGKTVQPLGIWYCAKVLTDGHSYAGLNSTLDAKGKSEKCDCESHESVVIGKQRDPKSGKCGFWIQNSWGTDCDEYSGDWKCEGGKIWVDADVLSKNIENYGHLR